MRLWRVGWAIVLALSGAAWPVRADGEGGGGAGAGVDSLWRRALEVAGEYELEIDLPFELDWPLFEQELDLLLKSGSLDDLAWILPYAQEALRWLDALPVASRQAAWLRGKLVYLEVAEEVTQAAPMPAPQPPPRPVQPEPRPVEPKPTRQPPPVFEHTRPLPKPPPAPPADGETAARRNRLLQDHETWKRRLGAKPPPGAATRLVPELKRIFAAEGIPPEWVWMAEVESSFNPEARSPAGAAGLFQFMPATAGRFGLRTAPPPDERLSPQPSARAAARYLRLLHGRFGEWPLALAAYNAGEGRVGQALRKSGASTFAAVVDHLPLETRMYVPRVLAVVEIREGIDPLGLPGPGPVAAR